MRIDQGKPDRTFETSLKGDLKTLNSHLPRNRKPLSELLEEKRPHVACSDGSTHYFKKKELEYLAGILNNDEQRSLLLPIIIEVESDKGNLLVRSRTGTEAKIFSKVLDMPVTFKTDMIIIFRPQLTVLRKVLKTTTQYAFTI